MTWREEAVGNRVRYSRYSVLSPILVAVFVPWAGVTVVGSLIAGSFACANGWCVDDTDPAWGIVLFIVVATPLVLAFLSGVAGIVETIRFDDVKGRFLALTGIVLSAVLLLTTWSGVS